MKIKTIIIAILTFITLDCYAYKLIILKEKHNGDGSGNYDYVNRWEEPHYVNIEGVQKLQSLTVHINCQNTGPNACPNTVAPQGSGGLGPNISDIFTEAAINAAQSIWSNADSQSSVGQGSGSDSGTVVTPDGSMYHFSIEWSNNGSGEILIKMIFEDAT